MILFRTNRASEQEQKDVIINIFSGKTKGNVYSVPILMKQFNSSVECILLDVFF